MYYISVKLCDAHSHIPGPNWIPGVNYFPGQKLIPEACPTCLVSDVAATKLKEFQAIRKLSKRAHDNKIHQLEHQLVPAEKADLEDFLRLKLEEIAESKRIHGLSRKEADAEVKELWSKIKEPPVIRPVPHRKHTTQAA